MQQHGRYGLVSDPCSSKHAGCYQVVSQHQQFSLHIQSTLQVVEDGMHATFQAIVCLRASCQLCCSNRAPADGTHTMCMSYLQAFATLGLRFLVHQLQEYPVLLGRVTPCALVPALGQMLSYPSSDIQVS